MSIVLITGSCGLVGSEASTFFSQKGFKVVGIDNNFRKHFFGDDGSTFWVKKKLFRSVNNYEHHSVDIRNKNTLQKIFKKYKKNIKLIIHCAAQPSHDFAKNNSKIDFEVNALGTLNMLNLTEKYCKYATFIHMSTNKVYGDNPNKLKLKEKKYRWEINDKKFKNGIDENFSLDNCTHSFFGVSKIYSDLITQEFGKNNKLNTGIFRAGCITGPNHSGAKLHGFLSYLVKSVLKNKPYEIIGYKGKQVRDNIHSYDLVNCFWEFYKKPKKGEVFNIGGGSYSNCSILEALKIIQELTNKKVKTITNNKNRVGDHIWYVSDINKFKKTYPKWNQKYNTKKIIEELISND
jgi:CDP-paratose 2-epimerase